MTTKANLESWKDFMARFLNEKGVKSDFVLGYLNESLSDKKNPQVFYISLSNVIRAYPKGIEGIAKKTGLGRRTLYRIGDIKSVPSDRTVGLVLKALGFNFEKLVVKSKIKAA